MNLITNFYSELLLRKNKTLLLLTLFLFNFFNVSAQTSTLISNCSDFNNGSAAAWPYVLVATTIDSGAVSQGAQTYTMNITSLPVGGANVRVYKTVANGNDFFGNPIVLTLGSNSITVSAVNFDRAVKFQFSSGDVEFDALSLNGVASDCIDVLPPSNSTIISTCNDFINGSNVAWPYVLISTTIDSGAVSQGAQTYTMNVTSLPVGGANVRVYKTVANGNDFFGSPIVLTLGSNSITVPAVNFDRAVKFQFSSGDVEFDALSLNGVASDCVSSLTSTENSNNQLFLKTFPNPSNGNLFIQSNELIERLQVQDVSGRVVLDMNPQSEMVHIKNSQLKNHFYFVKCYIKKEWVTKKIIINQR
jgi:uncharacterized protein YfaP (DUF2135 family)